MDEIVREYGLILLACVIGMILFGLIFTNTYSLVGEFIRQVSAQYF